MVIIFGLGGGGGLAAHPPYLKIVICLIFVAFESPRIGLSSLALQLVRDREEGAHAYLCM